MSELMSEETSEDLQKLIDFLGKNEWVDFRQADLLHTPNVDKYNWTGLEEEKERVLNLLKAYQRMLRIVPKGREDLAIELLKNGFQSALQIVNTPKKVFIQNNLKIFDNDKALAEQVYMRALAVRKVVTLQYVARTQQAEPHARVAGLVP
ncbi:MAG: hypothetical protein QNJ72_37505 [Pleurocapsa sp. MO_226.B13]|nr:hypothetical protein [Pleurocapsa sp. MO_226.B13]